MINWMATNNNMTGSYCLSKKSHVSYHVIFIAVCAQNVRLQHERKHVHDAPLAYCTFNNRVTQSGPLAVDASFQFVDVRDLGTINLLLINVKEVTDFRWFSGLTIIFWAGMQYPAWIHCCKRPKCNFCISQGSAASVLMLGGQNYCCLCNVSSRCCMPKIRPMFHGVTDKITLSQFFWDTVYRSIVCSSLARYSLRRTINK